MKKFASLILCLFPIMLKAQNIDQLFMKTSIQKLENAKQYTLKVAEMMPADKYDFKPVKEERSFGEQLLHLASNLGWLSSSYLANKKNPVTSTDMKFTNKDSIIAVLNKSYDYAIDVMKKFSPQHLADTVKFFAGPMTKLQIIVLINDHQTHHRAQALVF